MAELESVMQRLSDQTRALRLKCAAPRSDADEERALMVEGLAVVSEALLRVGRDVRALRLQLADRS